MFSVRSLISAASTASRMIRTYIHYPTNSKPSRTPLSTFLRRCALSTTPDNISGDGTDSGLLEGLPSDSKKKKEAEKNTQASLSADSSTSTTSSNILTASARDKRMAFLEDKIKIKDTALVSLSNKIEAFVDERRVLFELPESPRNELRLKSIGEDLADMRKREDRLTAEIAELKTEVKELKNTKEPPVATVTALGIIN